MLKDYKQKINKIYEDINEMFEDKDMAKVLNMKIKRYFASLYKKFNKETDKDRKELIFELIDNEIKMIWFNMRDEYLLTSYVMRNF